MIESAVRLYRTNVMKGYFQQAILPLTAAATLFGLAIIECPQGKPRRLLSLLYATVLFSLPVAGYIVKEVWLPHPHPIFIRSVGYVMMICCYLINLVSIYHTHWRWKRFDRYLRAMDEIDKTLRNLGIETSYSKLRRAVVIGLITWATWSCLLYMVDITAVAADGMGLVYNILFALLFDTPLHYPLLVDMHFWCVMGYAGTRLDCVNSALRKLVFDDNDCVGWFKHYRMTPVQAVWVPNEQNKRTIWTAMHLHFHVCQTLRNMHNVFEATMSLQMHFCCVYILCSVIYTFRMILLPFDGNKIHTAVVIWIWTVAFFVNIIVTNQICESVRAKVTSIGRTTIKLLRLMKDKEMWEDVSFVLLQMKHRPIRFSNLGRCDFGHRYIYEIFSSMVTMVVIILQLKTGLQT